MQSVYVVDRIEIYHSHNLHYFRINGATVHLDNAQCGSAIDTSACTLPGCVCYDKDISDKHKNVACSSTASSNHHKYTRSCGLALGRVVDIRNPYEHLHLTEVFVFGYVPDWTCI